MNKTNKIIYIYISAIVILLVLIIGVTFAFFVTTGGEKAFSSDTATVDLELNIYPRSSGMENPLIPQKTSSIGSAVEGTTNGSCVDNNGNTVCQVYEIVVENKSNIPIDLNGVMRLKADTIDDLRWGLGTGINEGFSAEKTYDKTETDLINPNSSELQKITLKENDNTNNAGDDTAKFYVVIYLEENEQNQSATNVGDFSGEVEFYSADGGISANFSS